MSKFVLCILMYLITLNTCYSNSNITKNVGHFKNTGSSQKCNEKYTYDDKFDMGENNWLQSSKITSSFISFIERLAGEYINFYIFSRYGMKEPIVNSADFLFKHSQSFYPFTSICELARYGYIPYEKMVLNFCTQGNCGSNCDVPSLDWLTQMVTDAMSANLLGGISIGNFVNAAASEDLFNFNKVILDNQNVSSFFEPVPESLTKHSHEVPRFILNVEEIPTYDGMDTPTSFEKAQKAGVTHIVLNDYNVFTEDVGSDITKYKTDCFSSYVNTCINSNFSLVLAKVTGITDMIDNYLAGGGILQYSKNVVQVLHQYNLDGVLLELDSVDYFINNPDTLCAVSIFAYYISTLSTSRVVSIKTSIGNVLPLVENEVLTDEKKTTILEYITNDNANNDCYTKLVNTDSEEWGNEIKEDPIYTGGEYGMPVDYLGHTKNFFETYSNFNQ